MSQDMAAFAMQHVAGRHDLARVKSVPADLWQSFGEAGLFGIGLPEAHGGRGGGYQEIAAAARTLAAMGGSLGLTISFLLQCLLPRFFILGFADKSQQRTLLPELASGEITISVAISEPEVGAHPKRLTTSARSAGTEYVIDGRKHWLTNGPMADLFIVLAITAEEVARKRFSTF